MYSPLEFIEFHKLNMSSFSPQDHLRDERMGLKVAELGFWVRTQISRCLQSSALFITAASLLCPHSKSCADWEHENNVHERLCWEIVDSDYQTCQQSFRKKQSSLFNETQIGQMLRNKMGNRWHEKQLNIELNSMITEIRYSQILKHHNL